MLIADTTSLLDAHLSMQWLRPESALWDAVASSVVSQAEFRAPSLDLGSGNGLFSFITAGGRFSSEYDWYRNADPRQWTAGADLYDTVMVLPKQEWIVAEPRYRFDWALDAKPTLLQQARALTWYRATVVADANATLPFPDESFQTIFSNILYWLRSPDASLKEIRRILRSGGRAWVCVPDPTFLHACVSYQWRERDSELLRLLNCGRREAIQWTVSAQALLPLAQRAGLRVVADTTYLSPLTLKAWDIGLRPLSPLLIKMIQRLREEDRRTFKQEWLDLLRPLVTELYELDRRDEGSGGFHFVCLEKD